MHLKFFAIAAGFCTLVAAIGIFVMQIMKDSAAFKLSKEFAQNSEQVQERIGQLSRFGFFVSGESDEINGVARFRYLAYGEDGAKVWLNFKLSREKTWKVDTLYLDKDR